MKGLESHRLQQIMNSKKKIIETLANEKWMRNGDLVKHSDLSESTVAKYVKKLVEENTIEKKIDLDSGKYPYPVYYRLLPKGKELRKKSIVIDFLNRFDSPITSEKMIDDEKMLFHIIMNLPENLSAEETEKLEKQVTNGLEGIMGENILANQLRKTLQKIFTNFPKTGFVMLWDPDGLSTKGEKR